MTINQDQRLNTFPHSNTEIWPSFSIILQRGRDLHWQVYSRSEERIEFMELCKIGSKISLYENLIKWPSVSVA